MTTSTAMLFSSVFMCTLGTQSPVHAGSEQTPAQSSAGMYSTYKTPVASTMFDHAFDPAPELNMEKLLHQLMAVADRLSRFKIHKDLPNVYRVPHSELENYVCGTHCAIKAWYKPGDGIFLDDSLNPETSVFDRSILLHEMVHFLQDRAGEYDSMDACNRWFHREVDAYNVQNRYLGVIGHPSRVAFTGNNCGVNRDAAKPGSTQVFGGRRRQTDPEH